MATVQQFIDTLQQFCKPDDDLCTVMSYYNGTESVNEYANPLLVVGQGWVSIVPNNAYIERFARDHDTYFATVNPQSGEWADRNTERGNWIV